MGSIQRVPPCAAPPSLLEFRTRCREGSKVATDLIIQSEARRAGGFFCPLSSFVLQPTAKLQTRARSGVVRGRYPHLSQASGVVLAYC